jgi:hypothetical protein
MVGGMVGYFMPMALKDAELVFLIRGKPVVPANIKRNFCTGGIDEWKILEPVIYCIIINGECNTRLVKRAAWFTKLFTTVKKYNSKKQKKYPSNFFCHKVLTVLIKKITGIFLQFFRGERRYGKTNQKAIFFTINF